MVRTTHTYATLDVPRDVWNDIRDRLIAAGYENQIHEEAIDMQGIGIVATDRGPTRQQLVDAITAHRSQKADDRCIEDDDRLYTVLGDGIKCDRRVGSKTAMLLNCAKFIERRCEGGGWPTYAQLEQRIRELEA